MVKRFTRTFTAKSAKILLTTKAAKNTKLCAEYEMKILSKVFAAESLTPHKGKPKLNFRVNLYFRGKRSIMSFRNNFRNNTTA